MALVTVDSFSKWIEADVVSGCTSQTTIRKLRHVFAAEGLPDILVSHNVRISPVVSFVTL